MRILQALNVIFVLLVIYALLMVTGYAPNVIASLIF